MTLMRARKRGKRNREFGDFQTPRDLSAQICRLLDRVAQQARSVVEPTCGTGNLLFAALTQFDGVAKALAVDINGTYVERVKSRLEEETYQADVDVRQADFFEVDWHRLFAGLPDPLLVIGNPPWVTNAELGLLGSGNLPEKSNFQKYTGLDAKTGKSNFDISEWMLIRILESISGRQNATMAMLCKTTVARRVLVYAWRRRMGLESSRMYSIDAQRHFSAAVDACLLVCTCAPHARQIRECNVYAGLDSARPSNTLGYRDDLLLTNVRAYERWRHLAGSSPFVWRSGIKHDCARVMELRKVGARYVNGLGQVAELEDEYIYPMLKSSEVAKRSEPTPRRWMLVPQRHVRDDTRILVQMAPKTWAYLEAHQDFLDNRASVVYRGRPRFSVFGVGGYSFSPWKVAVSSLYKSLKFAVVGPYLGRPCVLDDTLYFLPFQTRDEADYVASLLRTQAATEFLGALISWDAKRPITIAVLRQLNLAALARESGSEHKLPGCFLARPSSRNVGLGAPCGQLELFPND